MECTRLIRYHGEYLEACQISEKKLFIKIATLSLTIFVKSSVLYVWQGSEYASANIFISYYYNLGHTGRILNITMSPNGHFVASAGADETLRLWKCFEPDQKKTKPITKKATHGDGRIRNNIR